MKEEPKHRAADSCEGLLGDAMEGVGASPNLGASSAKKRRVPALSDSKAASSDADTEPVWASSGGAIGESEVEIYDGDIGEIGNYDYLFSSYCPATTAF